MNDIYFQGVWRMDWGLGNPNKTAALIAVLMLAVWTLPLVRRRLFWAALPMFTGLGMCLMHTMSRGGVVAAAAGFAVLLLFLRRVRPLPLVKILAVAGAVAVMLAGNGVTQTSARFSKSRGDRSITNRLAIWKQTPRMMVDAPWGWGVGNAGRAYMGWYQPLDSEESYRTLVNSHLTWLVELGWPMRLVYAFGWMAVFVLCCEKRLFEEENTEGRCGARMFFGIVGGMWTAFFVAAAFSSVAEAPVLWVAPVLGLAGVVAVRWRRRVWPSRQMWVGVAAAAALALVALAVYGHITNPPLESDGLVVGRYGTVRVGERTPRTWVVIGPDNGAVADTYPRVYRERVTRPPVGIAPSLAALPRDLTGCRLTVFGAVKDWDALAVRAKGCASLLLVAPDVFPEELELPDGVPARVVFGAFTSRPSATAWREAGSAQTLEGVGDFVDDWPGLVFGETLEAERLSFFPQPCVGEDFCGDVDPEGFGDFAGCFIRAENLLVHRVADKGRFPE